MESICGIYEIINTVNNKRYIGQSININRRWVEHRHTLNRNKSHNILLQNAWNKYGNDAFVFNILETCDKDKLDELEIHYIDLYKTCDRDYGYNLESGGNMYKTSTDEVKEKQSESMSKYVKEHPDMVDMLGRVSREYWSDESKRKKQSDNIINFFNEHPEEREKRGKIMRDIMLSNPEISKKRIETMKLRGKIRPIVCVETGQVFESRLDAIEWIGKPKSFGTRISAVLHGREKTAYGYHWKFADELQDQQITSECLL